MSRWISFRVAVLIVLMAIGTVWLRLSIVQITYEINQTNKMLRNSQEELEALKLQVARLKSPRRLELLAKTRFHLTAPDASQLIRLSDQMSTRQSAPRSLAP